MIIKPLSHWSLHKLLHRVFRLILLSNFYMVHSQMSKEEGLGFERQICGDGSNCSWPQRHSHWPSNEDFDLDFEGQSKQPKCSKIWSNFLSNYSSQFDTLGCTLSFFLNLCQPFSLSHHNKYVVSIKDKLSLSLSLSLSLFYWAHIIPSNTNSPYIKHFISLSISLTNSLSLPYSLTISH